MEALLQLDLIPGFSSPDILAKGAETLNFAPNPSVLQYEYIDAGSECGDAMIGGEKLLDDRESSSRIL